MTLQRIGFIGAGNMGSCLISGLLKQGYAPENLWVCDHHAEIGQRMAALWGIHNTNNTAELAENVDVIVLAVKPNSMQAAINSFASRLPTHHPLILSIAAGISTTQIAKWLIAPCPIARAMPNTPALLGQGMTGLFATDAVNSTQRDLLSQLFSAVGEIVWLTNESEMDIVTALSGSGPAYFFYFMECLIEAAKAQGLAVEIARKLTFQTALGAAEMVLHTEDSVHELRQKVTSKGGTTEQGINTLKDGKMAELLQQMLDSATKHSKTLREQYN